MKETDNKEQIETRKRSVTYVESQARTKKKKFTEKFNIQKELLNRDDIKKILYSLNPGDDAKIQTQSDNIFEKLDKNNLGFIKTDDLIKNLLGDFEDTDEELLEFYKKLNNILRTKSEEIVAKLKKLQTKLWVTKDNQKNLYTKINKIIYEITTQQLSDIIFDESFKRESKGEISFLVKYSQMEDNKQKAKDFSIYRRKSKKYSIRDINSISNTISNDDEYINNTLSTMLSPSVIAVGHLKLP